MDDTSDTKGSGPKKKPGSSNKKNNKASNGGDGGSTPKQQTQQKKKATPTQKQAQPESAASVGHNKGGKLSTGGKSRTPSTQPAHAPPPPSSSGKSSTKQQQEEAIHLDNEAAQNVNYAALKRMEPSLQDIIVRASHVEVYLLNGKEWERKNVAGSAFIVRRQVEPQFRFLVTNRLHTTNFIQDITPSLVHQAQKQFLFFKDRSVGATHGVWFYDEGERQSVSKTIEELTSTSPEARAYKSTPEASSRSGDGGLRASEESRGTTNKAGANLLSLITGSSPGADASQIYNVEENNGNNRGEIRSQPRRALGAVFETSECNERSPKRNPGEEQGPLRSTEEEREKFRQVFEEMLRDDSFVDMLIQKFNRVAQHTE